MPATLSRLTTSRRRAAFRKNARRALQAPRVTLRSQKLGREPKVGKLPEIVPLAGMNQWESRVYLALSELKFRFTAQQAALGGDILGGAKYDFLLHDFGIDLEVQGPFHATTEGRLRDLNRNLTPALQGYRVVPIYQEDFDRLKARILELTGRPLGRVLA